MTDPTPPQQQSSGAGTSGIVVPPDLQSRFPDLVDLVLRSESMNDEERQYWLNILPIMTPEQVQNLRDILTNERQQLAAIDAKYGQQIDSIGQEEFVRRVDEERRRKQAQRTVAETEARASEGQSAEDLLNQINQA